MAQVIGHLPSKHKVLNSNPSTTAGGGGHTLHFLKSIHTVMSFIFLGYI
jgi:hypothetical protein